MKINIIEIYKNEEEIKKIVERIKGYSFKDFKKTFHFEFSILEKASDIDLLNKTFTRFELIKSIELRENERGEKHYGFHYELEDGTFVTIALALDKNPPLIINGIHSKVNYKRFEKSLRKNYKDKFI